MSQTYGFARSVPVRLPRSIQNAAAEFARSSGMSLNYFIHVAIQERIERIAALRHNHAPVAGDNLVEIRSHQSAAGR